MMAAVECVPENFQGTWAQTTNWEQNGRILPYLRFLVPKLKATRFDLLNNQRGREMPLTFFPLPEFFFSFKEIAVRDFEMFSCLPRRTQKFFLLLPNDDVLSSRPAKCVRFSSGEKWTFTAKVQQKLRLSSAEPSGWREEKRPGASGGIMSMENKHQKHINFCQKRQKRGRKVFFIANLINLYGNVPRRRRTVDRWTESDDDFVYASISFHSPPSQRLLFCAS